MAHTPSASRRKSTRPLPWSCRRRWSSCAGLSRLRFRARRCDARRLRFGENQRGDTSGLAVHQHLRARRRRVHAQRTGLLASRCRERPERSRQAGCLGRTRDLYSSTACHTYRPPATPAASSAARAATRGTPFENGCPNSRISSPALAARRVRQERWAMPCHWHRHRLRGWGWWCRRRRQGIDSDGAGTWRPAGMSGRASGVLVHVARRECAQAAAARAAAIRSGFCGTGNPSLVATDKNYNRFPRHQMSKPQKPQKAGGVAPDTLKKYLSRNRAAGAGCPAHGARYAPGSARVALAHPDPKTSLEELVLDLARVATAEAQAAAARASLAAQADAQDQAAGVCADAQRSVETERATPEVCGSNSNRRRRR